MSDKELQIDFDNGVTFSSGQTVTGRVLVNLRDPKPVSEISVFILGKAEVEWTEKAAKNETVAYSSGELYFENKLVLYGVVGGPVIFQKGLRSFNFDMNLPSTLPSSYNGTHGHIYYTLKTVLYTNWQADEVFSLEIEVFSPVDLNMTASMTPIYVEDEGSVACCCKRTGGRLSITFRSPASGYAAWQPIPYAIDVENHSNISVKSVRCLLVEVVEYTATSPSNKQKIEERQINEHELGSIKARGANSYSGSLTIPSGSVVHGTLQGCSIISVTHELRVETSMEGHCNYDLDVFTPITLGTVPLVNQVPPEPPPTPQRVSSSCEETETNVSASAS